MPLRATPQTETKFRKVAFLNLKELFRAQRESYLALFLDVCDRAAFIEGDELREFETSFAKWVGGGCEAAGCANGTDAIALAARALGLPPGATAILPAMTYTATAEGLSHAGFRLKLVDIEAGSWLMDLDRLEAALTPDVKLIVPVHFYGQMVDMERVRAVADRHGCAVLEDAAQAHGATWNEHGPGYWGDAATYSFYPGKNLGAFGDGGLMLTKNGEVLHRMRQLRNHGGIKKYQHDVVGFNSRLDTLQAAFLNYKLGFIDGWNAARRSVAARYLDGLRGIPALTLPRTHARAVPVYHLFVVSTERRDALQAFLAQRGVETGVHYPKAIHQLPCYRDELGGGSFPTAEKLAATGLSLPMCPTLSHEDVEFVVESVRDFFAR